MAKAKDIQVTPDEAYGRAAAEIVRVRAQELFDHVEGVLDTTDIERVHDMRVASRRLRAVLEIFAPCFPRAPFRSVLTDVKAIADALGERRDPDVHIDAMDAFAHKVTATQRPGVERLLERLRERQAHGNVLLAEELERMGRRDLRARLMALADAAEQALEPAARDAGEPEEPTAADGDEPTLVAEAAPEPTPSADAEPPPSAAAEPTHSADAGPPPSAAAEPTHSAAAGPPPSAAAEAVAE